MNKTRLEAFSDGVLAIIITIMVLELKVPHETSIKALLILWPVFFSYIISFIYVGIYWGNHHHLLHTIHHVNGKVIWANMGLLFCLSLLPFTSAWMGENIPEKIPLMLYSINLAVCAVAFYLLQMCVLPQYTTTSKLIDAVKKQKTKGMISLGIYIAASVAALILPWLSVVLIIIPAILWVIPDKNIEAALSEENNK
ncbi:MAG TPA: TMEM175 family protein [Bacteroidia bacterium]|nr:DUF1211 domain-containing protein [Bacteroidia bacterium]QQR95823.1 MAG: DUF1211 domain-containing protein [Bacteroidota bacterium]MBP7714780.1 DUF1211 domain-containing protein [Bacteroidia bacterium]MBP8668362.1 DUF1211 domain-containing protein [Bacteroidia bacterium]HOZ82968.1 TMEM175 family protein [Bacteroidia bacterium]